MNHPVEIVLAADERYYLGLLVTAASMARCAKVDVELSFNILDGGIREESKTEFCETVKRLHGASRIQFHKVDLSLFGGLPTMSGSAMAYARLLLPRLLMRSDFVLYCDVDFLWRADVSELWALRDKSLSMQSAAETSLKTLATERAWATRYNIEFPTWGYFCSGLCLFNLNKFRECHLERLVFDFLSCHPDVQFYDQSALNFALSTGGQQVGMLPRKWQVFTHDVTPKDVYDDFALHFAGNAPWAPVSVLTDAEMLWFGELAKIKGISRWRALRMIHSTMHILIARAIFKVATLNSMTIDLCSWLLRACGRADGIPLLRKLPSGMLKSL